MEVLRFAVVKKVNRIGIGKGHGIRVVLFK
jgi:hypothetical protein